MMRPLQGLLHGALPCFAQLTFVSPGGPGGLIHCDVAATAGVPYWVDWGDGSKTVAIGDGASHAVPHAYAAGTFVSRWTIADPGALLDFDCAGMGFSGTIGDLSQFKNLLSGDWAGNAFTGAIPGVSALVNATALSFANNTFTSAMPALTSCAALQYWSSASNVGINGAIPTLTGCLALISFDVDSCALAGCASGVLALTITSYLARGNALPANSVDRILSQFATNIANRPDVVTVALEGGTNATPSAAGLASKATILAAKPGWTITHN